MTAVLVTVDAFREEYGVSEESVTDESIQRYLDEAESGLVADVGCRTVDVIVTNLDANPIGVGDVMRRAANLMARRNSPEGVAGAGDDGIITVPAGDPGSPMAVARIKRHLGIGRAVAV